LVRYSRRGPIDAGARLIVVDTHRIGVFDARTLRLLHTVTILAAPAAPSSAAISPHGRRS
jgi:hypothetical protein